jgi:hypothetical protein
MWEMQTSERAWKAFLYGMALGLFAIVFARTPKVGGTVRGQ